MTSTAPPALTGFDSLPASAFVSIKVIEALTGLSYVTIYRHIKRGRFPRPVKFSAGCSRWNVGELRAALKAVREAEPA